jgi:penicillin-binding protein 1B
LCIVWVGFDDNRQLDLQGADSALPIWTEFMKRALQYRAYRDARPFEAPDGIVSVQIDPESGLLATPYCPHTISEVYISGTQPVTSCPIHGGGQSVTHVAGWELPSNPSPVEAAPHVNAPPPVLAARRPPPGTGGAPPPPVDTAPKAEKPKEKKGLFRRLLGVFK